jgi:hypothetical protein
MLQRAVPRMRVTVAASNVVAVTVQRPVCSVGNYALVSTSGNVITTPLVWGSMWAEAMIRAGVSNVSASNSLLVRECYDLSIALENLAKFGFSRDRFCALLEARANGRSRAKFLLRNDTIFNDV